MIVHATQSDLEQWNTDTTVTFDGVDVDGYLRSASMRVDRATMTAYYAVDPADGVTPTDAKVLTALRDATCAQALAAITLAIKPNAGGAVVSRVKQSVGIGSGRITYADAAAATASLQQATAELVDDAYLILQQAGLTGRQPWLCG
ncbi:hypothetical protein SAMN05892883_2074 [Jatrophihabitans sp. GAS493]|uniref:hypothetical protein n=1 Tax=Jatrophihabitans sp. GAS493 TaxID=1907575 RepID=UPI000BB9B53F|nr:hypothetical protein [Jatrophihabitans sp. GAS493]SOD72724.1 hypothetical protein SAMN05892883_2074 [Jatrophihabitans sp. GAS493]